MDGQRRIFLLLSFHPNLFLNLLLGRTILLSVMTIFWRWLAGDWFSMRGNPPAADVIVEILEATDLRVGDLNGICFLFFFFFFFPLLFIFLFCLGTFLGTNCVLVVLKCTKFLPNEHSKF